MAVIPEVSVPVSMLIGTAIGIVAVRPNVTEAVKKFFRGTGDGMCDVVGLMAAAACFTAGMQLIGLTNALIDGMKNSQQIAQIGAALVHSCWLLSLDLVMQQPLPLTVL